MVQVREGAAVVLKLWKQSLTCSDGRKSPRQVLSFADWSSVNTDDSREKSEYHENGLTVSCAVIDRNESGSKTCWVSFVDWSPVKARDKLTTIVSIFLRVFFYFLKIEANDNDAYVMMRTGCCCKATQHQGESYSEVFSIWAGIDRVEQQRLRQPDVRGSWLTYECW